MSLLRPSHIDKGAAHDHQKGEGAVGKVPVRASQQIIARKK